MRIFITLLFIVSAIIPALSQPPTVEPTSSLNLSRLGKEKNSEPLVLAGSRTKRPDILRHFRPYRGGWDLTNKHYWASVAFTGAVPFVLAMVWLVGFVVALVLHHCLGWRINVQEEGSDLPHRICLLLLIVFTFVTAIGFILFSVGQGEFHGEAMDTQTFAINQSEYTVHTLTSVTDYLLMANTISVAQFLLPSDVHDRIEKVTNNLNTTANALHRQTSEISRKAQRVYNPVRLSLIIFAGVMLIFSVVGLVLSYLGCRCAIHIFIIFGWVLVVIIFILCGASVGLNNALSDTCMVMEDWVDNPQTKTVFDKIHPCLDQGTMRWTLVESKHVINDIVTLINQFIDSIADQDLSPRDGFPYYYNQSGPLLPYLCYPYDDRLEVHDCAFPDISLANASRVWRDFICSVSASGCSSPGRLIPEIYDEMVTAVNISMGLQHYTPALVSLQDCSFVRDAVRAVTTGRCRPLENHLRLVTAGVSMISAGAIICVSLWLVYASLPKREGVLSNLYLWIRNSCGF